MSACERERGREREKQAHINSPGDKSVSISRYHHRVHRPGNTRGLIIKHATAQSARTGFNRLCSTGLAAYEVTHGAAVRGDRSWQIASWLRRGACPRWPNEQQECCSRWQHVLSWDGRAWGDIARRAALCCVKIGTCALAHCAFCKCDTSVC